jgi:hypothetical protein
MISSSIYIGCIKKTTLDDFIKKNIKKSDITNNVTIYNSINTCLNDSSDYLAITFDTKNNKNIAFGITFTDNTKTTDFEDIVSDRNKVWNRDFTSSAWTKNIDNALKIKLTNENYMMIFKLKNEITRVGYLTYSVDDLKTNNHDFIKVDYSNLENKTVDNDIRTTKGNNGTMSCDNYCSSGWGNESPKGSSCIKAIKTREKTDVSCASTNYTQSSKGLVCECRPPKSHISTSDKQCAGDYNTDITKPCCGQKGGNPLSHQCPESSPTCVGYVYGKHYGHCTAPIFSGIPHDHSASGFFRTNPKITWFFKFDNGVGNVYKHNSDTNTSTAHTIGHNGEYFKNLPNNKEIIRAVASSGKYVYMKWEDSPGVYKQTAYLQPENNGIGPSNTGSDDLHDAATYNFSYAVSISTSKFMVESPSPKWVIDHEYKQGQWGGTTGNYNGLPQTGHVSMAMIPNNNTQVMVFYRTGMVYTIDLSNQTVVSSVPYGGVIVPYEVINPSKQVLTKYKTITNLPIAFLIAMQNDYEVVLVNKSNNGDDPIIYTGKVDSIMSDCQIDIVVGSANPFHGHVQQNKPDGGQYFEVYLRPDLISKDYISKNPVCKKNRKIQHANYEEMATAIYRINANILKASHLSPGTSQKNNILNSMYSGMSQIEVPAYDNSIERFDTTIEDFTLSQSEQKTNIDNYFNDANKNIGQKSKNLKSQYQDQLDKLTKSTDDKTDYINTLQTLEKNKQNTIKSNYSSIQNINKKLYKLNSNIESTTTKYEYNKNMVSMMRVLLVCLIIFMLLMIAYYGVKKAYGSKITEKLHEATTKMKSKFNHH